MSAELVDGQAAFDRFLRAQGLAGEGEPARYTPLTGGVSSDIWRVDLPGRTLCIKRALPKLKVAADWQAPVSRSGYEWRWIRFVAEALPGAAPAPLAQDEGSGLFAMAFLDPGAHPVWKAQLLAGEVSAQTAAAVGETVGRIHARSAALPGLAERFDSGTNFRALRLDPYLVATAARYPGLAERLVGLATRTEATRLALVHGDVSPKNILVGPAGPVILDAECAWWGDPAFDLAFCLNHLLLKRLVVPGKTAQLRASFDAFTAAYLAQVGWEAAARLEARAAELLPALLLARVDGKSPVEYLTRDDQKDAVRRAAVPLIERPVPQLSMIADAWFGLRRGA